MSDLRTRRRPDDRGVTLIELLAVMLVMSLIAGVLSAVVMLVLRNEKRTGGRLARAVDQQFVTAYLPSDLASAEVVDESPGARPCLGCSAPGTNVLQLAWDESVGSVTTSFTVGYRYAGAGRTWNLLRVACEQSGAGPEACDETVVARELASPPPTFRETIDQPSFAVSVGARNLDQPASSTSRNVTLTLTGWGSSPDGTGGEVFTVGAAGLATTGTLAPNPLPPETLGSSRTGRCGKKIALVLDTSGSVPQSSSAADPPGGEDLKRAAVSFVQGFAGTASSMMVTGFDRAQYLMESPVVIPVRQGTIAPFTPLIDPASAGPLVSRINLLDDRDGVWPGGWTYGQPAPATADPNLDGIHWDQVGSGTNWEDGLWPLFYEPTAYRPSAPGPSDVEMRPASQRPDLVVFITDGEPNRNRAQNLDSTDTAFQQADLDRAVAVAAAAKGSGTRVIGVGVGPAIGNPTAESRLSTLVGPVRWNGATDATSNAAAADYFLSSFANLGTVLQQIVATVCGGTVTVQVKTDAGAQAPGSWTVNEVSSPAQAAPISVLPDDPIASIDFTFDQRRVPPESQKVVALRPSPQGGFRVSGASCTLRGAPHPFTFDAPTGTLTLTVRPNEAPSCTFVVSRA